MPDKRRLLLAAAVLVIAVAVPVALTKRADEPNVDVEATPAPSSSTTSEHRSEATCSGSTVTDGMVKNVAAGDAAVALPPAVAERRARLVAAARTCDYDSLADLAADRMFQFTYGSDEDPRVFWRNAEAAGEPVLRMLVLTMYLPPVTPPEGSTSGADPGSRYYIWPAAAGVNPKPADWDALLRIYDDEDVARWRSERNFLAYRVFIDADGNWVQFVAGD